MNIYVGAPIAEHSEQVFLQRLVNLFKSTIRSATIFANFFPGPVRGSQIDFVVITDNTVLLIELKHFASPVFGGVNGPWKVRQPNGELQTIDRQSPYRQALNARYALSDALHRHARSSTSGRIPSTSSKYYTQFETHVCIYPEIPSGSSVYGDDWVQISGFKQICDTLLAGKLNPGWPTDEWFCFAEHLSLMKDDTFDSCESDEQLQSRLETQSYSTAFLDFYRRNLPVRHPTAVLSESDAGGSQAMAGELDLRQHAQLLGPSGIGKSLMAKHLALQAAVDGSVPILIQAKEYDGRLLRLLDRSIAHLFSGTSLELLRAASRVFAPVVLFVDGVNECPPKKLPDLLRDLQAFYLRWRIPTILTSQQPVDLPQVLAGQRLVFQPLSPSDKSGILATYVDIQRSPSLLEVCGKFDSGYEISLLAEVHDRLGPVDSREQLLASYVQLRCELTGDAETAIRSLGVLALEMRARFTAVLTLGEARRLLGSKSSHLESEPHAISRAIESGLLENRRGRCSFRHEMIEKWFQADALMRSHSADSVAAQICLPKNRDLAEYAIPMLVDDPALVDCIRNLCDSRMIAGCLLGTIGRNARFIAGQEVARVLTESRLALTGTDIALIDYSGTLGIAIQQSVCPSLVDRQILHGIGIAMWRGHYIEDVLKLMATTEERFLQSAIRLDPAQAKRIASDGFQALIGMGAVMGAKDLPVAVIVGGLRNGWFIYSSSGWGEDYAWSASLVSELSSRSAGEMYVIVELLSHATPDLGALLIEVLERAWSFGYYHLRLETLQLASAYSRKVSSEVRVAIGEFLAGISTRNPFLSTQLVETLVAYDLFPPPVEIHSAREELQEILAGRKANDDESTAYGFVCKTFEVAFQDVYSDAVEELEQSERVRLLVLAALDAPQCGFWLDWIMRELIDCDDIVVLPALQRWMRLPEKRSFMPQTDLACFLAAVIGFARYSDLPPSIGNRDSGPEKAWFLYARIIFRLHRAAYEDIDLRKSCSGDWSELTGALAVHATDPLYQLSTIVCWYETPIVELIAERFPAELLAVLERGLELRTELTSIFDFPDHWGTRTQFILRWLGRLGSERTAVLLKRHVEDAEMSTEISAAMRSISSRL